MDDGILDEPTAYEANAPRVLSETVDGETVIIDSRNGAYFSLNASGSHIWSEFRDGPSTIEVVGSHLAKLYEIEFATATDATSALVTLLVQHELLRTSTAMQITHPAAPTEKAAAAFAAPTLERFDDLEDLLLLDPIHDIDPQRGWPSVRSDG